MSDKNSISITSVNPKSSLYSDPASELAALQLQRERLQILLAEQQLSINAEAIEAKENKKAEGLALRRSTVAQLKLGAEKRAFAQANCGHLKENGKTAVGGQRDSQRNNLWICQGCLKEWRGNDQLKGGLPFHLRPDPEKVGGPDF